MRTIAVGEARVTVVNVGDSLWRLADIMDVPEAVWRPAHAAMFESELPFPSQCAHVAAAGISMQVDAGAYAFPPDSPRRPANFVQPLDVTAQLEAAGVRTENVTHLVLTHLHADHYDGVTVEHGGEWVPRFPHARCYVGHDDWMDAEIQAALADPASLESRTLGVLRRRGMVELVTGDRELAPGITLLAAPGESPGHQIVRLRSDGRTLYCLGDLFHAPVEVEHPEWMSAWCDAARMRASRERLIEAALAEEALLVAAHIEGVGRVGRGRNGMIWEPA